GSLIGISERALDGAGNIAAFILGGPRPGVFHIRRSDDFDVSDAALLPGGDLLLLERRFTLTAGISARIRRLPEALLRPGALADGPVLFFADRRHRIDNLEALDVHRCASGRLLLTLLSDDNYAPIQKTLLLRFELEETP
ncbi:MAG: esterase-like activity of phytase family protein, partial [Acidobacteria bacterium]|nr:esterase-like activity of phytase family protein [Acidobacteriota bacterium]